MRAILRNSLLVGLLGLCLWPAQAFAAPAHAFQPDKLRDCRKTHPFKLIDHPKMVPASDASFLKDSDYVLGVSLNGQSQAFPLGSIAWHHGANVRLGDTPVSVTYCNVCNTGIAFEGRLDGKPLMLDFYGLYNGIVALCDRATESVLLQVEGRFVQGPLAGKSLKMLPLVDTTWAEWKKLHPDTQVMSPETEYARFYRPSATPGLRGQDRLSSFFISTLTGGDLRLTPFEKVFGAALTENAELTAETPLRAYPLKAIAEAGGVVNDAANGVDVAVFVHPSALSAFAVFRKLESRTLTFESRKGESGEFQIFDKETGSRWSFDGRCEEGELKGKTLRPLVGHLSQWYGWAAYFPQTSIYARTDQPKPGNLFPEGGATK